MSLAKSTLPRNIELPEGETVTLNPPTVGEAFRILEISQNLEDEDDVELLFSLLSGLDWQSKTDRAMQEFRKLYKHIPTRRYFGDIINDILLAGYEPPETKDDSKDGQIEWDKLLNRYCNVFEESADRVWRETSFPFFMQQISYHMPRVNARKKIRDANIAMYAMGGSQEQFDKWCEVAEIDDGKPEAVPLNDYQIKHNEKVFENRKN